MRLLWPSLVRYWGTQALDYFTIANGARHGINSFTFVWKSSSELWTYARFSELLEILLSYYIVNESWECYIIYWWLPVTVHIEVGCKAMHHSLYSLACALLHFTIRCIATWLPKQIGKWPMVEGTNENVISTEHQHQQQHGTRII